MKKNKIIVIGSGRLGSGIAAKLSELGKEVAIIDCDDRSFRKLNDTYSGQQFVGDATNTSVLENSGIEEALLVAITTNDDNINILLAHVCFYLYNVPEIYVRLSDSDKGVLISNTTIHLIYPYNLSLDKFMSTYQGNE